MSDLISRTAAIAAIENARQLFALPDDVPGSRMVNAGFAAARGALEKVPPKSGWISVNSRLPEEDKRVLIYDDVCREVCVANLYDGTWHGEAYQEEHDASHWQPLPAPPVN